MAEPTQPLLGSKSKLAHQTVLTEDMIDSFPAIDPHVHVPGTISPRTAWELGLKNGLMHMKKIHDHWVVKGGPNELGRNAKGEKDPVGVYSNLFIGHDKQPLVFDEQGNPTNLDYNYSCLPDKPDDFSGFDAIQGTTQGHRSPPGGIQNEDDYKFVMRQYLQDCLDQKLAYVEPSQNITIAEKVLYPDLEPQEARRKFFHLAKDMVDEFATAGIVLRFTHCANKTDASGIDRPLSERANEWVDWLIEAREEVPGIFVGLTSAGHEKLEIEMGGPRALVKAYARAVKEGFRVEGHYGEGAGVEHAMKAWNLLPKETRFAHMFQIIELPEAIEAVRARGMPIPMSPAINIRLNGVLHYTGDKNNMVITHKLQRNPTTGKTIIETIIKVDPYTHEERKVRVPKRVDGIKNHYIETLEEHPFWALMREYGLPLGLMSDDPQQGGIPYKAQARLMAGFPVEHIPIKPIPKNGFTHTNRDGSKEHYSPLTAEEFALCNLNALQVAFCEPEAKMALTGKIVAWMKENDVHVEKHPLLSEYKMSKGWGARMSNYGDRGDDWEILR